MQQFQNAYRRREIEPYVTLLAPEFVFVLQEVDATNLPEGFWDRDQDSTCTRAMFDSNQVVDIRLSWDWFDPQPSTTTAGASASRIAVIVHLDVDIDGGFTTLRIPGDTHHIFLRQGIAENGEDTDHWFISEWRDLGNADGTGKPQAVESTTWGNVKVAFCEGCDEQVWLAVLECCDRVGMVLLG